MSRKPTPTKSFLSIGPCTRNQGSEGEVFVLSAEGDNQIEEGRQDCWNQVRGELLIYTSF